MIGGSSIGSSVGGLLGGVAVLAGAAGKGGGKERKKALEVWKKLQLSDFDFTALSPPEYRVLAEYMPEVYDAVVPEEFRAPADSAARADQARSLAGLREFADTGLPTVDRLRADEAARSVTGAAAANRLDSLRALASRGALSSGDALVAGAMGNQQASNLARDLGSDLAQQSATRRLQATGAYGQAAGQLRGQDVALNTTSAEIANRFAELMSRMRTDAAANAAAARGAASNANVAQRNQVGQANTANAYSTALENLNRQNQLRGQEFGQQLSKVSGLSNAYNQYGQYKDDLMAQKAQAIVGVGQGVGGIAGGALGGGLG